MEATVIKLAVFGESAADFSTSGSYPDGVNVARTAFELVISGRDMHARLVDLDDARVYSSVSGLLPSRFFVGGRDVRLRLDGIGTVRADNFRIYQRWVPGTGECRHRVRVRVARPRHNVPWTLTW